MLFRVENTPLRNCGRQKGAGEAPLKPFSNLGYGRGGERHD